MVVVIFQFQFDGISNLDFNFIWHFLNSNGTHLTIWLSPCTWIVGFIFWVLRVTEEQML